jgi:hypothetical protein
MENIPRARNVEVTVFGHKVDRKTGNAAPLCYYKHLGLNPDDATVGWHVNVAIHSKKATLVQVMATDR